MPRTLSRNDFYLIGYSKADVVKDTSGYSLWAATATAGLANEVHTFAYLKSTCTNEQAREAMSASPRPKYVVVPSGLRERLKTLSAQPGDRSVQYLVYEDMVWEKVSTTFADYLHALCDDLPHMPYYVTPRPVRQPDVDLSSEITDWMQQRTSAETKHIRVLRAPAGVGKTTVSRHIVHQIASNADRFRIIPIYVEATHWAKMSVERLDDVWLTIDNSLRLFDPRLSLTEELFRHLLNQGDLVFIFDGFDELCGHRFSPLSARDVLTDLTNMASEADARVLLTSRTNYWNGEVGASFPSVEIVDLATFTKPQAFDYLDKRFAKDAKLKEAARNLFARVRSTNQPPTSGGAYTQIAYHPLVLQLVADAAQHGIVEMPDEGAHDDMLRILRLFCERERARQQLQTEAGRQLDAFQDIAVDQVVGSPEEFDRDDLLIAGFDERDAERLADHPLVETTTGGRLRLRYDFLMSILVARHIVKAIRGFSSGQGVFNERTLRVLDALRAGKHSAMDHIVQIWPDDDLSAISPAYRSLGASNTMAKSFIFQLAKVLVNEREKPADRATRSRRVLTILGATERPEGLLLSGLYVSGNFDRFDLRSVAFVGCTFCDVQFGDCLVDKTTRFERCVFDGTLDLGGSREPWSLVKLTDCRMGSFAELVWADVNFHSGAQPEDVIRQALLAAMSKFWKHGRLKGSISAADWKTGVLRSLGMASQVLDVLLKTGLIYRIDISGVKDGGYAVDRDSLSDLQQFMDNRQMTGKVADAFRVLRRQSK